MMFKSRNNLLLLSVAASIFLVMVGCGGDGGGDSFFPSPPNNTLNSADLSLTKTVDIPTPDVGTDVVFTITLSNAGPLTATGVVVTDKLPSGFAYVTDDSGGAYDPATGEWTVGTLVAGASLALNITATVNPTGDYINRAEVTGVNENDPNSDDNFDGIIAAPPGIEVTINQIKTVCSTPGAASDKAYVTVIDQRGNPVTELNDLTFTLTESQNSQDFPVNNFSVDFANENFSVAIVMDYSVSMFEAGLVTAMEDAVVEFINQLSAGDEAAIIKFSSDVLVYQPFTTDKNALVAAVYSVFDQPSITELYLATIKGVEETALRPAMNRKAVLLINDGENNSSYPNITVDTAIDEALSEDIPVYTIGLGAEADWNALKKLASETGGVFYPSYQADDLTKDFDKLAQTLIKNQFVFTYDSALTGGVPAPATLTVEADYRGLTDSNTKGFTSCP